MKQTPLEFLLKEFSEETKEQHRANLGRFGLKGPQQLTAMGKLSGGQKSRVVFCHMAL